MDINIIMGLLGGSLGTIVITKIIECFTEKSAFERDLKRQFFIKKLEAADNAVRFIISAMDTCFLLQNTFNLLIKNKSDILAGPLFDDAYAKNKQLQSSQEAMFNAIILYFHLKPPKGFSAVDNQIKTTNYFSDLIAKAQSAEDLRKNIEISSAEFDNQMTILQKDAQNILLEINKLLQLEIDKFDHYLTLIKMDFKKYNL